MIRPTRRAVILMSAGAPLALGIGLASPQLYYLGLLWIPLVLTLIGLDILFSSAPPQLYMECPGAVEIGAPLIVKIGIEHRRGPPPQMELAVATGPRLRPLADDRVKVRPEEAEVLIAFEPVRRGTDCIAQIWARWTGPLRLIWRQRVVEADRAILITPNIRPVREAAATLLRDAQVGELARLDRGEGSEFEALSEWRSGMERRTIDWNHSARHLTLLARENRIERNNQIVFGIDSGRVMCEPVEGMPRVDRAISAALLGAYSALKLGDRVSLFGFDSRPRISSGTVSGVRAFPLIQRLAAQLDYSAAETNFTLALATLAGDLTRRSLVVVFTEFTDQTGAELMIRAAGSLMARHLVLFVILSDEELEDITAAEPETADHVSLAVTAATILRERRIVVSRLRHIGIHVLETKHDAVGPALVRQYLDFKRRNLL